MRPVQLLAPQSRLALHAVAAMTGISGLNGASGELGGAGSYRGVRLTWNTIVHCRVRGPGGLFTIRFAKARVQWHSQVQVQTFCHLFTNTLVQQSTFKYKYQKIAEHICENSCVNIGKVECSANMMPSIALSRTHCIQPLSN